MPATRVWVPSALSPVWKRAHGTQSRHSELLVSRNGSAPSKLTTMSATTTTAEAPRNRSQRPAITPSSAPSRQATGHASTMLHTCQSGRVPNHHSWGATPITFAATTRATVNTSPARNGGMPVAARASVRRASVPGAVATASTATSVDRVSRAAAITLVRPM